MPQSNSPLFAPEKIEEIEKLFSSLNQEQLIWMSGYSAGLSSYQKLFANHSQPQANALSTPSSPQIKQRKLTILYGSHSGNCKGVAKKGLKIAQEKGIDAVIEDMANYKSKNIKKEEDILIIVSTHGQGVPPFSAEELYAYLFSKKAPSLESSRFAVIALGDSSYKLFCKTGYDFHSQLETLGATSVAPINALDVDYNDTIDSVLNDVIANFTSKAELSKENTSKATPSENTASDAIFEAELLNKVLLNGRGSEKETYHYELSLEGSSIQYLPGDALEVYASNNLQLVDNIINHLQLDPEEPVLVNNQSVTIREALHHHFEITVITPQVVKKIAEAVDNDNLKGLLASPDDLEKYLYGADLLDVLTEYSIDLTAKQLTTVLRKLPPRLYSISSSQEANPDEVHITVSAVRFEKNSRKREGVASTYLADRLPEDGKIAIRVKTNDSFRLPAKADAPAIMIGPGTGIAPFRAFLQQREAENAKGKNWLFFGDQHFTTDFLYQSELLKLREKGVLTKIDVAFSRDQEEKIYVQHRMDQNAKELFSWLQNGASVYVCGDMKRMAKDVKEELLKIIEKEGQFTPEAAVDYFNHLKKTHRYQEDVY